MGNLEVGTIIMKKRRRKGPGLTKKEEISIKEGGKKGSRLQQLIIPL